MGKQVDINVEMPCVHDEMLDGELRLYLCLFNYDDDIPENWFDTPDYIDLKLHFSVDLIVDSIIESYELWNYKTEANDLVVFREQDKPMVDQLIDQFERGLARLKAITYEGEKNDTERN